MTVTLIDYGMGNLWSVQTAVEKVGYHCEVTTQPSAVSSAHTLILPGVGSFREAMGKLRERQLDAAIHQALNQGAKILGICLGMQLLCRSSTEDGLTAGLGLVELTVDQIKQQSSQTTKQTHIGYNKVFFPEKSRLALGLTEKTADFYFVHSFCAEDHQTVHRDEIHIAHTEVDGQRIIASFEVNRVYGVQFHPEKSQSNGLNLILNYLHS